MTIFQQAFSCAKRSAVSALKSALAIIAAALAIASAACEDAQPTATPAPIAAVPTGAPAPPTATPTAVPTGTPAPPIAVPTNEPTSAWLPTALPEAYDEEPATPSSVPSWQADEWIPTALPGAFGANFTPTPPTAVPTNTPAPPTATPTSATAAEARRIYEDAIAAVNALSSYRLRMDTIIYTGETAKISMDVYNRQPYAAKWKQVIAGGGQTPVEVGGISIGDYTYMKPSVNLLRSDDPNRGKWIRGDPYSESQDAFTSGLLSGIGVDAVVGTERLDGVETRRLRGVVYSNSLGLDMYERMEVDIWVGVADGLIRRVTAATATDADARERVNVIMYITMIFSDFDVPVDVKAPKDYITLDAEHLPDVPHYTPAEITPLDSGWTLAHLYDYGFSASTPPDWFISESGYGPSYNYPAVSQPRASDETIELSEAMIQYVFPSQITAYKDGRTHVAVFKATIIGTLGEAELSEYVDERMEQTKAALVIDGAIERRAETLPAGEAEVAEFAFRFSDEVYGMEFDDDTDYAQIQYFILSEGDAFILTFATTADRIDAMRPAFADIARTARIEPRP